MSTNDVTLFSEIVIRIQMRLIVQPSRLCFRRAFRPYTQAYRVKHGLALRARIPQVLLLYLL